MRLRHRKRTRSRQDELTRRAREESRALARKQRLALLSRVAPYITGGLLLAIRLGAAVIALVLEVAQASLGWLVAHGRTAAAAPGEFLMRVLTPLRTAAFVGVAAAVALGVSQFFDYRGVAVDAPAYSGELGATAPVPITDRETAGEAHLWLLLPLAAAALLLVVATYRGRPRLARAVSLCGLLGLAVAIAIDLPQGLDEGRAGIAFSGSEAQLLEGFWAEVSASAVLVLSGGLLALYSRGVRSKQRRLSGARKPAGRRRRSSRRVSPGLQAGP